jgi:YHS domain-containing protein
MEMTRRSLMLLLLGCAAVLTVCAPDPTYAEEDRLAIKGYDPVAYFTAGKPIPGDPQFRHEWDGALYQFASAKNLDLFKAEPDRYVPQFLNLCTVALSRGKEVVVDPNAWAVHEGRLYLFGGSKALPIFNADPANTIALAKATYDKLPREAKSQQ